MPLEIPEEQAVVRQTQSYVRAELPKLDPSTKKANLIVGMVVAFAKAVFHFYKALEDFANRQVHPQTATGEVLFKGWWTALTKLQRNPITAATGYVNVIGSEGAIIPLGSRFVSGNYVYTSSASSTVLTQTIRAVSLTFANGLAIFETDTAHNLATGQSVSISGSNDPEYNGEFEIMVTAANEFTYAPLTSPTGPAGSDVYAASTYARIKVQAEEGGQQNNIDGGTIMLEDAVTDVETEALVTFGGITGGTDLEDPEDFRDRILDALGSTLGMFTEDEIRDVAKNVPGVTRVWIRKARLAPPAGWPEEGQAKVLFMRDNDANSFPNAQEIADVKNALITKAMPTHMVENNLNVIGPNPFVVDLNFASITPDTASMRLAITAQLKQFFNERVSLGADLPKQDHADLELMDLMCAIKDTVDLETGQQLQSFSLNSPGDNISLGPDDIPILGQVIFS